MSNDDDEAVFLGVTKRELLALAASVKANSARLRSCPYHDFVPIKQEGVVGRLSERYRCRHCMGEVDASAFHWHEQGRRAFPVDNAPVPYVHVPEPGAVCSLALSAAGKPYPRTCALHGLLCGVKGSTGHVCRGGPLDGQTLAHMGSTYHVTRWAERRDGEPLASGALSCMPPVETAEYRLDLIEGAWIFQRWPGE